MREVRQAFQQRTSSSPSPKLRPRPAHIDELARVPRRYADCVGGALFRKKDPGRGAAAPSASRDGSCSSWSPDSPAANAAKT
jgi:hypothetical protein